MRYFGLFLVFTLFIACSDKYKVSQDENSVDFCERIHFPDSVSLSKELSFLNDSMKLKTGVYVLELHKNKRLK